MVFQRHPDRNDCPAGNHTCLFVQCGAGAATVFHIQKGAVVSRILDYEQPDEGDLSQGRAYYDHPCRRDEMRAAAMGVPVKRLRLEALILSAKLVLSWTILRDAVLHIGIITALVGAPFFASLILTKGRKPW